MTIPTAVLTGLLPWTGFVALAFLVLGLGWLPGTWWKVAVVLLSAGLAVVPLRVARPPRLGVDLGGGTRLVYAVLPEESERVDDSRRESAQDMHELVAAVDRRINPGGVGGTLVRQCGPRRIEILVPEVDRAAAARIKRLMSVLGTLEFRILANRRDHPPLIEKAGQLNGRKLKDPQGNLLAWWVPVEREREEHFIGMADQAETVYRTRPHHGEECTEFLVVNDAYDVNGSYLAGVAPGIDPSGRPKVVFTFSKRGGQLLGALTGANLPDKVQNFNRHLGIVFDGCLQSAPAIRSRIFRRGEITGAFTRQEVEEIVDILNAGSLPAALSQTPTSEMLVGPSLDLAALLLWTAPLGIALQLGHLSLVLRYRLAGLAASAACAWTVSFVLPAALLFNVAWTFSAILALLFVLLVATACNLLVCVLVRGRRRRGDDPITAVRKGWRRALVPVLAAILLLYAAAYAAYGFDDGLLRAAGFGDAAGIKAGGFVLLMGCLGILFTSLFALQAFLQLAATVVQNMDPTEMRRWFPVPRLGN